MFFGIVGTGIDIIENSRIGKLINNPKFLKRIYTENEISSSKKLQNEIKLINFFAKRFAAKEAFSKAAGVGIGQYLNFVDIEIYNDIQGKPMIKILNNKEQIIERKISELTKNNIKFDEIKIDLSLSDEKSHSIAMIIISKYVK